MKIKRFALVLLSLLIVVFSCISASAWQSIDTSKPCSLTVSFAPNGAPAKNVSFSVYFVANYTKSGSFTLTEKYSHLPIDIKNTSTDHLRKLITTVDGYIVSAKISPDATKKTGANGFATFSNLKAGMYLVRGEKYKTSNGTFIPYSFLVSLPTLDNKGNLEYSITSEPKWWVAPDEGTVNLEVLKVWNDNSNPDRPEKVRVELYADNKLYDAVNLDRLSNWRYRWYDLPAGHMYVIKETSVPSGYTVTVEKQGNRFVVTNTKPDEPDNPTPDDTTKPSYSYPSGYSTQTDPSGNPLTPPNRPSLPVTGVLWWPVPILICVGFVLLILGFSRRRIDNEIK